MPRIRFVADLDFKVDLSRVGVKLNYLGIIS